MLTHYFFANQPIDYKKLFEAQSKVCYPSAFGGVKNKKKVKKY